VKRGDGPARAPHFIINKSETIVCGRGRKGCEEVSIEVDMYIAARENRFLASQGEIYSAGACRSHGVATLKPRDQVLKWREARARPWLPTLESAERECFSHTALSRGRPV
jgi:predicted molibdopterin-dependent oxidoreductase YjgC